MNNNFLKTSFAFVIGALLGGLGVYAFFLPETSEEKDKEIVVEEKIITKNVVDTVVVQKPIYLDTNKVDLSDSTALKPMDSTIIMDSVLLDSVNTPDKEFVDAAEEDEDIIIISDRLIAKRKVSVDKLNGEEEAAEKLGLSTDRFSDELVVEFWESPLELTGYELSKNRLKLFGFNPNESIKISYTKQEEFLDVVIGKLEFSLVKTTRFKTLNF
jgi:hypothetical protein